MKIYFEDGPLRLLRPQKIVYDFAINAANGPSWCIEQLKIAKENHPNCTIYTNSIWALDNTYAWNEELGVPEIYMRDVDTQHWWRIDDLTDRELRRPHNIMKMYIANEFRNFRDYSVKETKL